MMGAWDTYQNRITAHGGTRRDVVLAREERYIRTKLKDGLSYYDVDIYPAQYGYNIESDDATEHIDRKSVAIVNSSNLNEKTMLSMPSEDIEPGSLVDWMNNFWLVSERDANTTVYAKTKLLQCNHLLKWITPEHEIIQQWCVVEDGTKYITGEHESGDFAFTRGDSRIAVQIARNKYTVTFDREYRFLIDDPESPHKLAYLLTKPLKKGNTYNEQGIFQFVLQEVMATENDNHELGIADYYKHFLKGETKDITKSKMSNGAGGKKVWI